MKNLSENRGIFHHELAQKIKALILVISFFHIFLTTGVLYHKFNHVYTVKIQVHISELVQKHSQNIDIFIAGNLANISYLANQFEGRQAQSPKVFIKKILSYWNVNTQMCLLI